MSSRVLAFVAIVLVAAPVRAGGHLWLSVVAQPPAVYKYDLATGQLTRFELPGLGCFSSNLAVDGTHLYLGGLCDQTFWKGDLESVFPVEALTYSPPLSDTNSLGDGAWRASNGHLSARTAVRNLGVALGEDLEIPRWDWGIIAMGASSAVPSPVSVEESVEASTWGKFKAKFRDK